MRAFARQGRDEYLCRTADCLVVEPKGSPPRTRRSCYGSLLVDMHLERMRDATGKRHRPG